MIETVILLPLIGVALLLLFLGAIMIDSGYKASGYGKGKLRDKAGGVIGGVGVVVGILALFALIAGAINSTGSSVFKLMEREIVPVSRIKIDPNWDKETVLVACDATSARGQIELLGKRTSTSFQVEAYRMRAGGKGYDLTRPAGFSLSQRKMYRSGQAPSFHFGNIRADGKWHSRKVEGTLSFPRGEYWLLDTSLGVRGKTGEKTLTDPRWLEEGCRGRLFSF